MATLEESAEKSQVGEIHLSREDRRLLLGASLRLLGYRFVCGKRIVQEDLIRVVSLADDAGECIR